MSPAEYKDFQRAKAFNLEIVKSPTSSNLLALLSKKLINPPQHPSATPRKRPVFELNMVNYCTALNRLAKGQDRPKVVMGDVRFALLMKMLGKKIAATPPDDLGGREIAGI